MWEVLLSYIEIGYGWLSYKGPAIIFFVILVAVAVVALYYKRKKGKDISIHPPKDLQKIKQQAHKRENIKIMAHLDLNQFLFPQKQAILSKIVMIVLMQ